MSGPFDKALASAGTRLLRCRGASYEGDIFSILTHAPFIIRSFEFGLADGAIDCSQEYPTSSSFADRFWDLYTRRYDTPSELVLFDVKSSVLEEAGNQAYHTTVRQRRHVAFYVGICASDPTFVTVIPNYLQEQPALVDLDTTYTADAIATNEVAVNVTRASYLPPSAYGGIDQCASPYRMPLHLLREAVRRIRKVARGESAYYINPWTSVEFRDWKPLSTSLTKFVMPADNSDQASAFEAVMEIYRVANHERRAKLKVDFVGLQPTLADFKFVLDLGQVFVQHKLDNHMRARNAPMNKVQMARGEGLERRYYCSTFDRFDFFCYQFRFSKGAPEAEYVIYFIPERELPDEFYTSTESTADFELYPHLHAFRVVMDGDGDWVLAVERTIREYFHRGPRRVGERPMRVRPQAGPDPVMENAALQATISSNPQDAGEVGSGPAQGRRLFKEAMSRGLRTLFYGVMTERSGVLVVLATGHPWADVGLVPYRWSEVECRDFLGCARVPKASHHFPSNTEGLPISFYTQHAEAAFSGPNVRARHFRRLDASDEPRLTIWDLGGPDTAHSPLRLAVIPSDDFMPTDQQAEVFNRNLALDKNKGDRDEVNPNLSALLKTALFAGEYGVGGGGPSAYEDGNLWPHLWELLAQFASIEDFEHPQGYLRRPGRYRYTLQQMYQRQLREYRMNEGSEGGA